jgi:hypothetical protein
MSAADWIGVGVAWFALCAFAVLIIQTGGR